MFGQNFRCQARAQTFCERLKKARRDGLAGAQIGRLIRSALNLVQRGKGPVALLIQEHCLFPTEGSVITDPYMDIHGYPSRVIKPSSLPSIISCAVMVYACTTVHVRGSPLQSTEATGDFDHPTKGSLLAAVRILAHKSQQWGTPRDIVDHHKAQIERVLQVLD